MNTARKPFPQWYFLLVLIVFVAVLGVAYINRELIADIILVPILYVLWVIDLALQIFGQPCIWILALIIAVVLSFAFSRHKEKQSMSMRQTVYGPGPAVGRIQFWRRQVRVNSGALHVASYRNPGMWQLVVHALAYHHSSDIKEIEEQLRSGQLQVPVEVRQILGLDIRLDEPRQTANFIEAIRRGFRWVVESFKPKKYIPNPSIEKVAKYIENLLESDNGKNR